MGGWGAWLLGKIRAKKRMNEWLAGSLRSPKSTSDLIEFEKKNRDESEWVAGGGLFLGKIRTKKRMNEWLAAGSRGSPQK